MGLRQFLRVRGCVQWPLGSFLKVCRGLQRVAEQALVSVASLNCFSRRCCAEFGESWQQSQSQQATQTFLALVCTAEKAAKTKKEAGVANQSDDDPLGFTWEVLVSLRQRM